MSLSIKQLDLFTTTTYTAKQIKLGAMFLVVSGELCMRIKPVAYLLNSSLIQDKLAQGYVMYVALESGKCSWLRGDAPVEPVTGTLSWSK
jgi:hypothetical protein